MSRSSHLFVIALTVAAVYAILAVTGPDHTPLRVLVGISLVTLLPGHAVTLIIDPAGRLGRLEWFAVAVGSSLSLTALLGLALADAPSGLNPGAWLAALCILTLSLILIAALSLRSSDLTLVPEDPNRALYLPLAMLLIGCLAVLFFALTPTKPPVPGGGNVLQLWAQPTSDRLGVRIGVENITARYSIYQLKVTQGETVLADERLTIPAKSRYALDIEPSAIQTTDTPVVATLRNSSDVLLRRVSVWPQR